MQALNIRLYDKKALFSQTLGHKRKLNFCCLSYRGNHSNTPPPVPLCRDGKEGYSGKKQLHSCSLREQSSAQTALCTICSGC